jgi:cation diffusion facilitator CzcD-associated flavoprotein CzcO
VVLYGGDVAPSDLALPRDVTFAVIGTGFSGLGAAIALRRAGYRDLVILERADDVGGTWRDNTYPGCRCDVQSNLYSFSFAPKPDWSESYPSQPELRAYLGDVADRYQLLPDIRFGQDVLAVRWDEAARRWQITTSQGELSARYVLAGTGFLVEPARPDIPGADRFAGSLMHSARWDPAWSAAGRRVAVIGTGASAIQIVPVIQPDVEQLTVFQRTPAYVVPHDNRPVPRWQQLMYRYAPVTQRLARIRTYWTREMLAIGFVRRPELLARAESRWRQHLERAVTDPGLRARLTPGYRMGCKRIVPSNDFYPALAAANVELVTDAITEIAPDGVITADGRLHPADTIILATGFRVTDSPMHARVTGRGGRPLAAAFGQTYLGTVLPGFPFRAGVIWGRCEAGHT